MVEPRTPHPTTNCRFLLSDVWTFPEVSFEAFKYLHVGLISDIERKTAIAKVVGLETNNHCIIL